MFQRIGPMEILLILAVLLLLFGARRIPDIARALGKSLGEFKKGQQEGSSPDSEQDKEPQDPAKKT